MVAVVVIVVVCLVVVLTPCDIKCSKETAFVTCDCECLSLSSLPLTQILFAFALQQVFVFTY